MSSSSVFSFRAWRAAAGPVVFLACSSVGAQTLGAPMVVTATRQATRVDELLADVTVIDAETLAAAGPLANVTDLLARQPGLEVTRSGNHGAAAHVYLRGNNSGHVLLLIDGVRVGSLTLGEANWSMIPVQQIDHIEILRGSASSLYGSDAVGGVVQIFTRQGDGPPRFTAEAGLGSYGSSAEQAGFSGGAAGWRYSLQLANKRERGFSAIDNRANSAYNPDRDGYRNTSVSGSLAHAWAPQQEIGVDVLHNEGWTDYDYLPAAADHRQKQFLSVYNLHLKNQLTDAWRSTLRIGESSDEGRQYADDRRTSRIQSRQTQYQWQNDLSLPLGTALFAVERVEEQVSSDVAYARDARRVDSMLAGWSGTLGRHRLQFNLRHDDNSQFGEKNTGFAAYGYQLSPAWRASAAYGTSFKAPTFNDLYWPGAGNPDLKPETARNREVALHYESGWQQFSATYYHNRVDDLINWAPIAPGSWFWLPANVAAARLRGLTLTHAAQLGDFSLQSSADFQDPRDLERDKLLPYRARRHASFALGRRTGAFDWNLEVAASGARYEDAANRERLGGYALVNLNAGYRLARDWTLFARVDNLLDRDYRLQRDYNTAGFALFAGIRYAPQRAAQ
jgi:vitamin B12 transporter